MEQIINAITTIQKNGKSFYSRACRQRVMENFDFKKVNQQYFEIYEKILSSK